MSSEPEPAMPEWQERYEREQRRRARERVKETARRMGLPLSELLPPEQEEELEGEP